MADQNILDNVLSGLGYKNQCDNFINIMLQQLADAADNNFRDSIRVMGPALSHDEIATLRQHRDIMDPKMWLDAIGDPNGERIAVGVSRDDIWSRFAMVVSAVNPARELPSTNPKTNPKTNKKK